jgi:hypothetical protein
MIDRPVFIIGTGRSGTTLLFNLLAFHPQLGWFSTYGARLPRWPWIAVLSRIHDLPRAERFLNLRWRWLPRPTESYEILDAVTGSLFTLRRPLLRPDSTNEIRERFRRLVADYLRFQGKTRFLCKYTGLPRIDFILSIFPDAKFIHVYRDGRAVANSFKNVDWWANDMSAWRYGEMRPDHLQEYEDSGRDPIVLAGIAWKALMDEIEEESGQLPGSQLLRIRYDDLIRDVSGEMGRILGFCDLPQSSRFDRHLARLEVSDMDRKWSQQLSEREISLLDRTIGEHLVRYGFER